MLYLMNTRNYNHPELYGISNAIYDRQISPKDNSYKILKRNAKLGCYAIVARYADNLKKSVIFDTVLIANTCVASYVNEELLDCLVVLGQVLSDETLTKTEASENSKYSQFFDKNGNFKTGKAVQFS